jgi:hypothetical protein
MLEGSKPAGGLEEDWVLLFSKKALTYMNLAKLALE